VLLPVLLKTGRRPVIFSRWTGMGDIICTLSAARELMKRHPGATFIYNCHPDFAAVPKLAGIADRVTTLEHVGVVGHWYKFLLAGFYHFAHRDDTPGLTSQEPMVTEFCRQFNLPILEEHLELPVTNAGRNGALALFAQKEMDADKLVLIHPGPSWTVREWPLENWAGLVAALRERGFTSIAQLGVARYLTFGQMAIETIPGTVSLVDEFSVEECVAAIAQAKLFIGIDSGLLHIAAGTRTPSVGIFGPTRAEFRFSKSFRENFATSRVECAGCEHVKPRLHWFTGCPHNIRCMKSMGVPEVLACCLAELNRAPKQNSPATPAGT
jgi:ADP-heptose:LPS heptosyltransferase